MPKQLYITTFYIACGCLCFLNTSACGDDSLGTAFHSDLKPNAASQPELLQLNAGEQLSYFLHFNYRPTQTNPQSSKSITYDITGHLCLHIDQVRDNALESFATAEQSYIDTSMRMVRSGDHSNAINSIFQDTLLWHFFFQNPRLERKLERRTLTTQTSPLHPDYRIENLLIFDPRSTPGGSPWLGWQNAASSQDDSPNFINALQTHIQARHPTSKISMRPSQAQGCQAWNNPTTCTAKDCLWALPLNAAATATPQCLNTYQVSFSWANMTANAYHELALVYYSAGVLAEMTEKMKYLDQGQSLNSLATPPPLAQLCAGHGCLTGTLKLQQPFNQAQCQLPTLPVL